MGTLIIHPHGKLSNHEAFFPFDSLVTNQDVVDIRQASFTFQLDWPTCGFVCVECPETCKISVSNGVFHDKHRIYTYGNFVEISEIPLGNINVNDKSEWTKNNFRSHSFFLHKVVHIPTPHALLNQISTLHVDLHLGEYTVRT